MNAETTQKLHKLEKIIKWFARRLHQGENPLTIKAGLKEVIKDASPRELAHIESKLLREPIPRSAILTLCGLRLDLFHESLTDERKSC